MEKQLDEGNYREAMTDVDKVKYILHLPDEPLKKIHHFSDIHVSCQTHIWQVCGCWNNT